MRTRQSRNAQCDLQRTPRFCRHDGTWRARARVLYFSTTATIAATPQTAGDAPTKAASKTSTLTGKRRSETKKKEEEKDTRGCSRMT